MKALDFTLYSQLTTPATTLNGLVGARVFNSRAPQGTPLPYCIYQGAAGGLKDDTSVDFWEGLRVVKGLATSIGVANSIDEAAWALLHNAVLTVSGWTLVSCMRESDMPEYDEDVNGITLFHRGSFYRIRLSK
jgi:hypothetical protein